MNSESCPTQSQPEHTNGFSKTNDPDAQLMRRAARGDRGAYGRLYEKYLPILARYVRKHYYGDDIEDVVQSIFSRVCENEQEYSPTAAFSTYLITYASRILWEYRRRLAAEAGLRVRLEREIGEDASPLVDPYHLACQSERRRAIHRSVGELSTSQKEAIELFYFQGSGIEEGATRAGCSVEAFKGRLKRARHTLKDRLKAY